MTQVEKISGKQRSLNIIMFLNIIFVHNRYSLKCMFQNICSFQINELKQKSIQFFMKIQQSKDKIQDSMAKKERGDKMMWEEKEMWKKKRERNNRSLRSHRDSVFNTFIIVKKISII